jgi:WD40 repeat protein
MSFNGHTNVVRCLLFLDKEKSKKIVMQSYYYDSKNKLRVKKQPKVYNEEQKEDDDIKIKNLENYHFILSGSRDKTIKLWDC